MQPFNELTSTTRRRALFSMAGGLLTACQRNGNQHGKNLTFHFQGIDINHLALNVSDVIRTEEFIRTHFGSPNIHGYLMADMPDWRFLRVNRDFTAITSQYVTADVKPSGEHLGSGVQPGLNHFCISVENYDADVFYAKCLDLELKNTRSVIFERPPGGIEQAVGVFFEDPDGIEVQISAFDHDASVPISRVAPEISSFRGTGINHIALRVTDIARSRDFYQELFGLPVVRQSDSECFLGLGTNFLALFKGDEPGMDHYCYSIENYDPTTALVKLKSFDLNAWRHDDRVYFEAPDGITIQVASEDHQP